jgi:VTC domain
MIEMPLVERPRNPVRGSADHEIKFAVPASAAGSLRTWIGGVCRPDAVHPPGRVTTVYFDTPSLAFLSEKIDSDYLKTKVRVRWYGPSDSRASTVFAEVKHRVGNRRDKVRMMLDVAAADLARWPLWDARWPALLAGLRAAAPPLPAQLAPVLTLTYTRHRFDDPGAARVTLDSDIRATGVNIAMVQGHAPVGLDDVVFEYKSRSFDLPPHLAPIVRFGGRRTAFSKYLACYQAVTRLVL